MPRYTFECQSCGNSTIEEYSMVAVPQQLPVMCKCGKPMVRIFGAPTIRFRGKGWARHPERDGANRKRGPQQ